MLSIFFPPTFVSEDDIDCFSCEERFLHRRRDTRHEGAAMKRYNANRMVVAILFLSAAHPARAALIDITATGYVSYNHVTNAYFASTFPDLTLYGKSATIEMRLDTALAGFDILGGSRVGRAAYAGGSCPGLGANWIQTTAIRIGGVSLSSLLPGAGNFARCDIAEVWDQSLNNRFDSLTVQDLEWSRESVVLGDGRTVSRETRAQVGIGLTTTLVDFVIGLLLEQSFTFNVLPEIALADIVFSQDYTTCFSFGGCSTTRTVNLNEGIQLQSVKITKVPEPATFALLIAALPLLVLGRRRSTPKLIAA
jgi:hypothetical protein